MPRSVDRTGTRVRARRAPWAAAAAEGGACRWRRRLSRRTRRTSSTAHTRRAMSRTRTSGCVRRPLSSPPRHSPSPRAFGDRPSASVEFERGRPDALARRERPLDDDARSSFPDARPFLDRRRTRATRRSVPRIFSPPPLMAFADANKSPTPPPTRLSCTPPFDRKRRRSTCATSRTRLRT